MTAREEYEQRRIGNPIGTISVVYADAALAEADAANLEAAKDHGIVLEKLAQAEASVVTWQNAYELAEAEVERLKYTRDQLLRILSDHAGHTTGFWSTEVERRLAERGGEE